MKGKITENVCNFTTSYKYTKYCYMGIIPVRKAVQEIGCNIMTTTKYKTGINWKPIPLL